MSRSFRRVIVVVLAGGVLWSCGSERVTVSEGGQGAGEQVRRSLSKAAVDRGVTQAVVVVTVREDGMPVPGAAVEFSRSISGRSAQYAWSGTTDEVGRARVALGENATGYYQARAWQDGNLLGRWSSIPINGGYEVLLDLAVGGKARVTGSSLLFGAPEAIPVGSFEAGPLGAVEVGEGEAVQIRSLLAHTGVPSIATLLRYSIELAIRDFGSIHGHEIELGESIDAMCSPEGGRTSAAKVIADPRVPGVVGTLCSGSAVAASPLLSAAGLVMISPSNTSPALTSDLAGNASPDYHPGYFRTASNDLYQGQAVADFAYSELGLQRMVSIDDGDPYTTGLTIAFGNAFRALGGEIVGTAQIEKGDIDMTDVLAAFAAVDPDGIFFPLFESEGSPFAEQVREVNGLEGATLITDAALLVSEFLGTPQSEGIYFAGPDASGDLSTNVATGKNADEILAAFESTYGESPGSPYWAHGYDATSLLLSAINSVAVEEGGKLYVDRAALREEIAATSGFQGIIGVLSCDDFGDCGTGRVNIYHHTDSAITEPAQLPVVYHFSP